MSKLGKRLIAAADEALAIGRGEADPATYNMHVPSDVDARKIRKGAPDQPEASDRPVAVRPFRRRRG
jgi:hypothetical protein